MKNTSPASSLPMGPKMARRQYARGFRFVRVALDGTIVSSKKANDVIQAVLDGLCSAAYSIAADGTLNSVEA